MDNEKKNGQPEQDWFDQFLSDDAANDTGEADRAAQEWLDQLLASTEPEGPVEEPAPAKMDGSVHEEPDWFRDLESPAANSQPIGTDEHAVSQHAMSDLADMELEKIMQEAMSDDWDVSAIEQEILSEPIPEAFPDQSISDTVAQDVSALYTDGGDDPEDEIDRSRKVRPKRKNGYGLFGLPHLASTAIWAVLCITIGISLGRVIWLCAADLLAFGRPDQDVVITVTDDDTLDSITEKLYEAGLIQYRDLFKIYAKIADVEVGADCKISTGTFTLNTLYDYHALVSGMSPHSSYRETTEVMIPEGYTCAQIFALLEDRGVCTVEELENYCIESDFSSYWFLDDVEKHTKYCLEGFLFPDTYEFYTGSSAKLVFITLLNGFSNHFSEDMLAELDALNEALSAKYKANGASDKYVPLTVKDVVTVASMIEKETAYSGESRTIASVIYNRLTNPYNYPNLQIDATVVYALGGKSDLTAEDLAYDSPYNTYLYEGLPAGPISNPGANSLKAAIDPDSTGYYFYALDPDEGVHQFFKTRKEHESFVSSLR